MRSTIVLVSLLLLPVLVIAHLWLYDEDMKPDLAARALSELKHAGIHKPAVQLAYLDATISGIASDVEVRERAAQAVRAIKGLHYIEANNLIVVPARVAARREDARLALEGWLPDEKSVQGVIRIVGEFRPDLELDAKKLRISKFVSTGSAGAGEITAGHRLLRPILAALRVPATFAVEKAGDIYLLKGSLPSEEMRRAVIEAVEDNPGGWKIDATALIGAPHVEQAAFTKNNALPVFLRSYFSAPTPGTLEFSADGGPRIVADATRQMEAEWIGLLRGVSGAAKVDARLNIVPSIYLLQGYRPTSEVVVGTLEPLVEALNHTGIVLDAATHMIPDEEAAKLDALAPLMMACGPGLHVVLSASGGDAAHNDSASGHKAACEAVKAKLVALGVPAAQMEIAAIGALHPQRALPPDAETQTGARVELLVK